MIPRVASSAFCRNSALIAAWLDDDDEDEDDDDDDLSSKTAPSASGDQARRSPMGVPTKLRFRRRWSHKKWKKKPQAPKGRTKKKSLANGQDSLRERGQFQRRSPEEDCGGGIAAIAAAGGRRRLGIHNRNRLIDTNQIEGNGIRSKTGAKCEPKSGFFRFSFLYFIYSYVFVLFLNRKMCNMIFIYQVKFLNWCLKMFIYIFSLSAFMAFQLFHTRPKKKSISHASDQKTYIHFAWGKKIILLYG